jgi:hypothetical protein
LGVLGFHIKEMMVAVSNFDAPGRKLLLPLTLIVMIASRIHISCLAECPVD